MYLQAGSGDRLGNRSPPRRTAVDNQTGLGCRQNTDPIPNFSAVEDLDRMVKGPGSSGNYKCQSNKRRKSCLEKRRGLGQVLFSILANWCAHWDMNPHPFL